MTNKFSLNGICLKCKHLATPVRKLTDIGLTGFSLVKGAVEIEGYVKDFKRLWHCDTCRISEDVHPNAIEKWDRDRKRFDDCPKPRDTSMLPPWEGEWNRGW